MKTARHDTGAARELALDRRIVSDGALVERRRDLGSPLPAMSPRSHTARRTLAWAPLVAAAMCLVAWAAVVAPAAASASAAGAGAGRNAPTITPADGVANPRDVQLRLVALRYLPSSAVTGSWDYRTAQAVTAFQAWEGLQRDGVVGPRTLAALARAHAPRAADLTSSRSVEVYRDRGVTLLIEGGRLVRAVHSSSGRAGYTTPSGGYSVFRKEAMSWSYPYSVWLPYASYFNGGIAFHSYAEVPPYPASHGCIRISAPEAPYVYAFAGLGTRVTVY